MSTTATGPRGFGRGRVPDGAQTSADGVEVPLIQSRRATTATGRCCCIFKARPRPESDLSAEERLAESRSNMAEILPKFDYRGGEALVARRGGARRRRHEPKRRPAAAGRLGASGRLCHYPKRHLFEPFVIPRQP